MGRTEKSQDLAPPAVRKDIRAKQARNIINKVIPATLASNSKARQGAESSELISDPARAVDSANIDAKSAGKSNGGDRTAYVKRKGQGRRKAKDETDEHEEEPNSAKVKKSGKRRNASIGENVPALTLSSTTTLSIPPQRPRIVRIITTDSLTAAQALLSQTKPTKKSSNPCILNMASPLRPGGGVLAGATSQEEFLCARTTLLPSLKESFYRLPEYGGILTTDVLVFRSPGPLGDNATELGAGYRYYIDVISAGMLRFPDLEGEEDGVKTLSKKDRDIVERKMRAVLRIAQAKGVKKLVLGAWGCGAYGNPVADIAEAWARVLSGEPSSGKKGKTSAAGESWPNLEDVVFAIPNLRTAEDFAQAFGGGIEVEAGPRSFGGDEEEESEDSKATQELRLKIEEMECQVSKVWNADLRLRLGVVLDGLNAQLKERQENDGDDEDFVGPEKGGINSQEDHEEAGSGPDGTDINSSEVGDGDELGTDSSDSDSGVTVES